MRVYRSIDELPEHPAGRRALSVGVFDGVHRGHARILDVLKRRALADGLDSTLALTFDPHPLSLLRPERAPHLILTLDERLAELERQGLDEILVLAFTPELAATPYDRFTRELLVPRLGLALLVAGYDFHLGRGRQGSAEAMAALGEELGFEVEVLSPCYLEGGIVSSTRIRRDLEAGNLAAVRHALGHGYPLGGTLERGQGLGRELGFPTLNLAPPPPEKALPPPGVYLVSTRLAGRKFHGLMNLGWAPTLRERFLPEVHLLDFSGEAAVAYLEFNVIKWLRPEQRFPDAEALKAQIRRDLDEARRLVATELLEES